MVRKTAGGLLQEKRAVYFFSLILLIALLAIVKYVTHIDTSYRYANERELVDVQLAELRNHFEYEINTTLNLTMGGLIYVATNPDLSQQQFSLLAKKIHERAPYIRNFGLARNNVISHIYPYKGNEAALGLNYMSTPAQRDAVLRAIRDRQTVIAGPVDLVQGGKGFISRVPIFLERDSNSYWGMSSIVVMVDDLMEKVGLQDYTDELNIALRGKDARGYDGDVFYGDAGLFNEPGSVTSTIRLPNGSWILAAAPKQGWLSDVQRTRIVSFAGIMLALLITTLVYCLLMKNIKLKQEELKVIESGEHKNRFFTQVTHELRTPLTAIHGAIRLLESGELDHDKALPLIKTAERNSQRLIWMINDILDLKKLESGELEYKKSRHELQNIAKEAVDEVKDYAEQQGVGLAMNDLASSPLWVEVDGIRIQQVLINLLTNAIKFSRQGGDVTVSLESRDGHAYVEVADSGPGVDEKRIDTIFDEFGQSADDCQANRHVVASTGLGLTISKQLVEGHGGEIGCYNREAGGAVFHFDLPRLD